MISCENGFIEIMEYPRANEATITYLDTGKVEKIIEGNTQKALLYEILDMEKVINKKEDNMHLNYTKDVMELMTKFRETWNLKYPEEE